MEMEKAHDLAIAYAQVKLKNAIDTNLKRYKELEDTESMEILFYNYATALNYYVHNK